MGWNDVVGRCFTGEGSQPVRVVLEQTGDKTFRVHHGFRYTPQDIEIAASELESTDLTSVPRLFRWFVSRHGRHTLAALLHDALVERVSEGDLEGPERLRAWASADATFLEALACLKVPPIRRVVMWAAVSGGTRRRYGGMPRAGFYAWIAAAVSGTIVLGCSLPAGRLDVAAAAIFAPIAGALLWGRAYRAGLVAGYAAPLFLAPVALAGAVYVVYLAFEWLAIRLPGQRDQGYELPRTSEL